VHLRGTRCLHHRFRRERYNAASQLNHLLAGFTLTKTNCEGKGIAPDIKVPEKDALSTAQRIALQHLVEKTTDEQTFGSLETGARHARHRPASQVRFAKERQTFAVNVTCGNGSMSGAPSQR